MRHLGPVPAGPCPRALPGRLGWYWSSAKVSVPLNQTGLSTRELGLEIGNDSMDVGVHLHAIFDRAAGVHHGPVVRQAGLEWLESASAASGGLLPHPEELVARWRGDHVRMRRTSNLGP